MGCTERSAEDPTPTPGISSSVRVRALSVLWCKVKARKATRKRGNPPDSCCYWANLSCWKEGTSVMLPIHHISSSAHPILFFFNGATQHGFVAHSSIFLQAVFRAELFFSTGWSFFAYLIVFNCEASRTGCLGAAAAHS